MYVSTEFEGNMAGFGVDGKDVKTQTLCLLNTWSAIVSRLSFRDVVAYQCCYSVRASSNFLDRGVKYAESVRRSCKWRTGRIHLVELCHSTRPHIHPSTRPAMANPLCLSAGATQARAKSSLLASSSLRYSAQRRTLHLPIARRCAASTFRPAVAKSNGPPSLPQPRYSSTVATEDVEVVAASSALEPQDAQNCPISLVNETKAASLIENLTLGLQSRVGSALAGSSDAQVDLEGQNGLEAVEAIYDALLQRSKEPQLYS